MELHSRGLTEEGPFLFLFLADFSLSKIWEITSTDPLSPISLWKGQIPPFS